MDGCSSDQGPPRAEHNTMTLIQTSFSPCISPITLPRQPTTPLLRNKGSEMHNTTRGMACRTQQQCHWQPLALHWVAAPQASSAFLCMASFFLGCTLCTLRMAFRTLLFNSLNSSSPTASNRGCTCTSMAHGMFMPCPVHASSSSSPPLAALSAFTTACCRYMSATCAAVVASSGDLSSRTRTRRGNLQHSTRPPHCLGRMDTIHVQLTAMDRGSACHACSCHHVQSISTDAGPFLLHQINTLGSPCSAAGRTVPSYYFE